MKIFSVIFLLIGLCLIGAMIWGNFALVKEYNKGKTEVVQITKDYKGRIFFTDKDEYDTFKAELANRTDLVIHQLDELSSDKPLVMFRIGVNGTADFSYGTLVYEKIWYASDIQSLIFGLVVLNAIGGFLVYSYFSLVLRE